MFKHAFHGGPAVEVLSTSGKNPLEPWKQTGTIQKSFDSQMKGYIFTLDGQAKISLPKDDKNMTLGLIQQFLVMQIFIPLGKNIHIEVGITDSTKTRRRLIFHSGAKEIVANPLHARIPITLFRRNQWTNLCLDIASFTHYCFKSVNFRSIDYLEITASCKLRRIFTMKNPLFDDQYEGDLELEQLTNQMMNEEMRENMSFENAPQNLSFPVGFTHFNQFIFPQRIKNTLLQQDENNINSANNNQVIDNNKQKIGDKNQQNNGVNVTGGLVAFGQRVTQSKLGQNQKNNQNQPEAKGINKNQQITQQQDKKVALKQIGSNRLMSAKSQQQQQQQQQQQSTQRQQLQSQQKQQQQPSLSIRGSNQKKNKDIEEELKQIKQQDDISKYDYDDKNNYDDSNNRNDYDGNDLQEDCDDSPINYSWKRKEEKDTTNKKKVTKEDLKEQEHFLYLQDDDEEEAQQQQNNQQSIKQQQNNKNNIYDYKEQQQQKQLQSIEDRKKLIFSHDDEDEEEEKEYKNPYEYTKEIMEQNSPRMNEYNTKYAQKQANNNQKVKQFNKNNVDKRDNDDDFDNERQFKNSKYNNFNLDSWGIDKSTNKFKSSLDNSNFIEEAFDINHENLMNYYNNNNTNDPDNIVKRKSNEYKENPMYIEIEFNNDNNDQDDNIIDYNTNNKQKQDLLTQSYQKLESSRKEERRPFSPPFKQQQQQQQLSKVQQSQNFNENSLQIAQNLNKQFDENNSNSNINQVTQSQSIKQSISRQSVLQSQQYQNSVNKRYNDILNDSQSDNLNISQNNDKEQALLPKLQQQISDASDLVKISSVNSKYQEYEYDFNSDPYGYHNQNTQKQEQQQDDINDDNDSDNNFDDYRDDHDDDFISNNNNKVEKQIEYLKVQRTEILRDSLDQTIPTKNNNINNSSQQKLPQKATVENEEGDILEVIYDPILLCYYDPKSNSYYQLKDQQ